MHQKDYINIRLEAPGVRAKDSIPNFALIRNCRLGNGQGRLRPEPGGKPHDQVLCGPVPYLQTTIVVVD